MGNICSCFEAPMEEIIINYYSEPIDNYFYSNDEIESIYRLYD